MAVDPPDASTRPEEEGEEEKAGSAASNALSDPPSSEKIKAVARRYAGRRVPNPDPGVWAVLTAISQKARQRPQGMNIILKGEEHYIGRLVEDNNFRLLDYAVSGKHCKIYRGKVTAGDDAVGGPPVPAFLKDTR